MQFHPLIQIQAVTRLKRVDPTQTLTSIEHHISSLHSHLSPKLLQTQVGIPYTNTHKHRTSYFKYTLTLLGSVSAGSPILQTEKKREILAISS